MPRQPNRSIALLSIPLALCIGITGCSSRFINATISNAGTTAITQVTVDYPSASFGTTTIAPGAQFQYRFKVQGSKAMHLEFTDARNFTHEETGPVLTEGQEGTIQITIGPNGDNSWDPHLNPPSNQPIK